MTKPLNIVIDIPTDKGVHVKTAGIKGEKYVYKYTQYYRNNEGKPRNKSKVIGKVDESGKMIPNSNYYEMFNVIPDIPDLSVWCYGYTYLIQKSCKDMGLWECLQETFGDQTNEIVAVVAFMIRKGNAVDDIDDFQEKSFIPGLHKLMSSQSCSKLFGSITALKCHHFFKRWVTIALKNDTVCYDITSVSSYSKEIPDVEYGYNRDHEDLPQFNIGMFCCETSKIPLFYNRYNGSLTDKTNLSHVLENAKSVGIKNVKFILDGGFMSEDCFKSLNKSCNSFTIGIPAYLDISKDMVEKNINLINSYSNKLANQEMFCVQESKEIYGVSGKLMLYFDPKNHAHLCSELSDRIDQLFAELSELKRCPISKLKRFDKFFSITKHDSDSGFDFVVDINTVDQLRRNKGFFLLFSTDMKATPEDSLYYYRAKDSDEKLFDQIKVDMGGGRIRTHNERTTDGKVFVTFIALAIRAYILGQLGEYLAKNSSSLKRALNKLENIYVVYSNGRYRFTKALTKQQKEILASFDAIDDIS
ncbi:MAG: transposase, partial [Deltaproteobacteria bacterium]|nr:transposase [Deltaproteobacteria bacterium]